MRTRTTAIGLSLCLASTLLIAQPASAPNGPGLATSSGPAGFVIVIALLQVTVVVIAMILVWMLWSRILQFLSNSSPNQSAALAKVLGGFSASSSKGSVKAVGIGLTLVILLVALGAAWVLGLNNAT